MAVIAGLIAYFESFKTELGAMLPSLAGPKFRVQQLELWQQAEEVLLLVLAATEAKGLLQQSREPMAVIITRAVELAKLFLRPVTESWLRWEGPLLSSAKVRVAEFIINQVEVKKVNRLERRQQEAPELAKLRSERLRPLAQLRQSEAEELKMSSVGSM